ncbi:MAG: hypothetical protein WBI40_13090 [Methylococcaceae bacterium]
MIPVLLIMLLIITFVFVEYFVTIERKCQHTHWAQFQSRKYKMCVDCGKLEPIEPHL